MNCVQFRGFFSAFAFVCLFGCGAALAAADSADASGQGAVGAPYIKYSPETGLVVGLSGLYYFRFANDRDTSVVYRPCSISGGATYSTRNQISTGMDYALYFDNDKVYVFGGFDYKRIPYDFFGVGNFNHLDPIDSYTPLWIGGDLLATWNFIRTQNGTGLNAGICTEVRHDQMLSSDSAGVLQRGGVPGSGGGLSAGAGIIVTWDTRDNVFSSQHGTLIDFRTMWYGKGIGSTFDFTRMIIDMRQFIPAGPTQTLALQGLLNLARGDEPFYTMGGLGGDVNMRGYFEGRFRANTMAVLQAEYRMPVWWRFGLAAFADVGEVGGSLADYTLTGLHFSGGAGIRFLVTPEERLTVRLDFGIGADSSELYLSVNEPF